MSGPLFSGDDLPSITWCKAQDHEPRQTKSWPWLEQPKVVMGEMLSGEMLKEVMAPAPRQL